MERYIVIRKATGIGSDLISVLCALDYAIKTGRHLVIDWRFSRYLSDPDENLFNELFDISAVIEGCHVQLADANFDDDSLPSPLLHSDGWPFVDYHHDMLRGEDRPEHSLIVTRPMHHLPSNFRQAALLSYIRPKPSLMRRVANFRDAHFAPGRTVGIHIRHGNGETLRQKRDTLISNGIDAIYLKTMQALNQTGINDPTLFLCTDSGTVRKYFLNQFEKVIYYESELLEDKGGPIHTDAFGLRGAQDAVIEMWLLGECNGLIYNPSWFSHYARVMGQFTMPAASIDDDSLYGTVDLYHARVSNVSRNKFWSFLKKTGSKVTKN